MSTMYVGSGPHVPGYPSAPVSYPAPGYGYPTPAYRPDVYLPSYGTPSYPSVPVTGYPQQTNPFGALASLFSGLLALFGKRPQQQAPQVGAGPVANQQTPEDFVAGLYRNLLGREPDPQGFAGWVQEVRRGVDRQAVIGAFTACPEYQQRQAQGGLPAALPVPQPATPVPGAHPFGNEAALQQAVTYAANQALQAQVERHGGFLPAHASKEQENRYFYDMITMVMGQLRLRGLEVERLARHTSHPVGDPQRYVNDAIVLPDGRAIDLFGGDGSQLQFHDLCVPSPKTDRNTGLTDPTLPPSSSTLGV